MPILDMVGATPTIGTNFTGDGVKHLFQNREATPYKSV